jgi:uncharacterized protein (DUF2236 family)
VWFDVTMTTVTETTGPAGSLPLSRSSEAWRVNAEPIVFAGGGRAVLLQVAHPGVGAGVEQHSTYASDPWGRLFRTVDVMMKLSFATPDVARRQERKLAAMHRRVVGTDEQGRPYNAMDPRLQLWVWATLVDTAALTYELVHGALTPDEKDRFYQDSKLVAYGCGVERGGCPARWSDFQSYFDAMVAEELIVGDAARAVAHATMRPPLPPPFDRLSAGPHRLVTVGLLPPTVREQFGFEWSSDHERQLRRVLGVARIGTRITPRVVRELGARMAVAQKRPLQLPWLQRRGAELTAARMAELRPNTTG